MKATAIAAGGPLLDQVLIPITSAPGSPDGLFATAGPSAVATSYALAFPGSLVLAVRGRPLKSRSWWWWLAVAPAIWPGPALMPDSLFPISVSRMALELGLLLLAVCAARMARDPRLERAKADCMKKKGFKYIPFVMAGPAETETQKRMAAGDYAATKEFRTKYGYQVFAQYIYPMTPPPARWSPRSSGRTPTRRSP